MKAFNLSLTKRLMKTMTTFSRFLPVLATLNLLSGCASDPAPAPKAEPMISGDAMLRESEGIAKLGDRWQHGKDLVDQGNAMVEQGKAKITEGNRLIDEGNKIIKESEERYKTLKH
jgi:hypothetical protein